MRSCPSRRRELFELVDGALPVRQQEKLHAHLVTCSGCRAELASLRGVRERLRAPDAQTAASESLTSRLIGIAGEEAADPLYARPFDRPAGGALPSRRRSRQTFAGAVTVTCLLLVGLVGVGWAAAPPPRALATEPAPLARDEFAAVLAETPLANPAVSAARAGEAGHEKTGHLEGPPAPTSALHAHGARAELERANQARAVTAYAGTQSVQIRHLAGYWVTRADVDVRPGQGAQVRFSDGGAAGRAVVVPQAPTDLGHLAAHHELLSGPGPMIAGHPTVVVEARVDGRPRARWWLHVDSAVVLWEQTFAADGTVVVSAGFKTLQVGAVDTPRHLPPKLTPTRSTAALTLSSVTALRQQGWHCGKRLAGLDLVTLRSDRADPMLHSVYSDGVTTLSLLQQRGALVQEPDGFVWDPQLRVHRSLGLTTMYTWHSGDVVFTVATDGRAELAERAVRELPHVQPVRRTHVERVLDGWRHLAGVRR